MFQIKSPFGSKYFWVPNFLVDHFFHDTDGESIKLYIFLLRMAGGEDHYSAKLLGNILSMTEDQVIESLKLWESRRLLHLEYKERDIDQIQLTPFIQDFNAESNSVSTFEQPAQNSQPQQPQRVSQLELVQQAESRAEQKSAALGTRPEYQPTQLLSMQEQHQEYELLLYTVRKILEKDLTANDIAILYSFHDWLKLPFEVIQALIVYCAGHDKKDFSYIEALAIKLAEKGVTIPEQVDAFLSPPNEKRLYEVIRELGMGGTTPTEGQRELYKKWTEVYQYTHEIILRGCQVASTKSNRTSFQYLDAILTNWYKDGVIDGPKESSPSNQKETTNPTPPSQTKSNHYNNGKGKTNSFHNFPNASTDKYAEAIEKLINEDFGRYE